MIALQNLLKNKYVQAILRDLKPCIVDIILATGLYMVINKCVPLVRSTSLNVQAAAITVVLAAVMFGSKPLLKLKRCIRGLYGTLL